MSKTDEKINALWSKLNAFKSRPLTMTLDDVFKDMPEGDFKFEDVDPGDAFVYYCDDCKTYHTSYSNWKFERTNGKRAIYNYDGDESGKGEIDEAWEEGEDATEILTSLQNEGDEYFKEWAKYYLDCAETGYAPLEKRKMSKGEAIKAAEENINYLYMGQK